MHQLATKTEMCVLGSLPLDIDVKRDNKISFLPLIFPASLAGSSHHLTLLLLSDLPVSWQLQPATD